jgi:hypothetical protein
MSSRPLWFGDATLIDPFGWPCVAIAVQSVFRDHAFRPA